MCGFDDIGVMMVDEKRGAGVQRCQRELIDFLRCSEWSCSIFLLKIFIQVLPGLMLIFEILWEGRVLFSFP